jgi:hypothetical protein
MEQSSRHCPYCAEPIRATAVVCKHCHRDLQQSRPASPIVGLVRLIATYVKPLAIALGIVSYILSLAVLTAVVLLKIVP